MNKRLSKQSWGWWFETLLCPLWRHRNGETSQAISSHDLTWFFRKIPASAPKGLRDQLCLGSENASSKFMHIYDWLDQRNNSRSWWRHDYPTVVQAFDMILLYSGVPGDTKPSPNHCWHIVKDQSEQISMKSESLFNDFHWKGPWKCRLQNDGHLVEANCIYIA